MSDKVHSPQNILDTLKEGVDDPLWNNAKNAWLRSLGSGKVGNIGEKIALQLIGGEKAPNNKSGYDIKKDENLIEVKLSSVTLMNGYPILSWKQIRPSDPYTHILFIAIYPNNTRVFLVPRGKIPADVYKYQHGREKTIEIFQIHTRRIDDLFPWMVNHEINQIK